MGRKSLQSTRSEKKTPMTILERINSLIHVFEKERLGIIGIFIWIVFLSSFRMWSEAYLLDYPYKEISMQFLFYHAHIVSFFITAFIGGITILKFITKEKIARLANLSAIGFLFSLIPPFLDVIMHNNPDPYSYVSPYRLIETISSFSGSGVFFELFFIATITSVYVFFKLLSKGLGKAVMMSLVNWVIFIVFFIILGSPLLPDINRAAGDLIQPLMLIRYIIISIIMLLLLLYNAKKQLMKSFIYSSRLITTAHFMVMVIIGIVISGHLQTVGLFQLDLLALFSDPFYQQVFSGNIAMFFLSIIAIMFTWQATIMINHVYDASIDKIDNKKRLIPSGLMTKYQVKKIAIVYAIISLGLGFLMGIWSFVLILLFLVFAIFYSVPPFRLRDSIFSTAIIGIGSMIAFFLGYYTPAFIKVMHGEQAGMVMRVFPGISNESFLIGLLIFVALSIGPIVKDYKDYQGDKKAGVKNIFTVYGLEKGVKITSFLLPIPFLCLLLLFHSLLDIVILLIAGMLAGILFYQLKNTKLVFSVYFPVIIYCLLRWFSFL